MPSLADFTRSWLLRQLGLTSSNLSESDLQMALFSGGFSGAGMASNRTFSVGKYYPGGEPSGISVNALTLSALYLVPFEVGKTQRFDRIACEVTTVATAGGVCRMGIYDTGVDGMPGNLVLDAGTIDATIAAAAELVINVQLNTGLYWLGIDSQVAAASVRSDALYSSKYIASAALPAAGPTFGSYRITGVAGALPATAAGAVGNAVPPKLYLRAA